MIINRILFAFFSFFILFIAFLSLRSFAGDTPDGMAFVKGGCFEMGDTFGGGRPNEKPVHKVCLNDYYLDRFEVTNAEFEKAFPGFNKSRNAVAGGKKVSPSDNYPVVNVTWFEAEKYCASQGKHLPTEAQWEYAARSRGRDVLYATISGQINRKEANYGAKKCCKGDESDGYFAAAPVGSYPPNELGLYDMTGNVNEWMSDWHANDYYAYSPEKNPQGLEKGTERSVRGGSWYAPAQWQRASCRGNHKLTDRVSLLGFRCAKDK